jgi:Zn-dependent protease
MFGMAGETQFDLRFRLFGVPVRVHPYFWLTSALLFWDPDQLEIVALGILCMFISVLIHELGHALVLRYFRWPSEVVLFILGGYATSTRLTTWRQIASLAAGPGAGMAFAVVVYVCRYLVGKFAPDLFQEYPLLYVAFELLLFSGILVNLMNLMPCLPLDGGQIMAALVSHYGRRGRQTNKLILQISIASGAAVAVWCAYCIQSDRGVIPYAWLRMLDLQFGFSARSMMIFFGYLTALSIFQYNEQNRW